VSYERELHSLVLSALCALRRTTHRPPLSLCVVRHHPPFHIRLPAFNTVDY